MLRQDILDNYSEDGQREMRDKIFEEARALCDSLLKKLEKFVAENANRMEKASSHKFLTLLLHPLEGAVKLCGSAPEHLPANGITRINQVLASMKQIFKAVNPDSKLPTPPTSLVESYIEITLMADPGYQKSSKLAFETYFRLFMHVKNLLWRSAQQNAIPMAKLVRLCTQVDIPADDKQHFYADFGDVVKKLLSLREPHTFFTCLAAFIEWAEQTDLPVLNFMVPDDSNVQNLLQMYMENYRIDIGGTGQTQDLDERLTRLAEDLMQSGLQDVEIMEKFCAPTSPIPLHLPAHLSEQPP